RWTAPMPTSDRRALLVREETGQRMIEDFIEAFRAGARGPAWEAKLYTTPWGFRLEEITMEVYLWQGEKDVHIRPEMGRYQARQIPNCRATFFPDESHFSLVSNRLEELLVCLIPSGAGSSSGSFDLAQSGS
ncbi:MAG: alpha/beta fold hydrolase, partial [Ardenticatenaceae bacterium]